MSARMWSSNSGTRSLSHVTTEALIVAGALSPSCWTQLGELTHPYEPITQRINRFGDYTTDASRSRPQRSTHLN